MIRDGMMPPEVNLWNEALADNSEDDSQSIVDYQLEEAGAGSEVL